MYKKKGGVCIKVMNCFNSWVRYYSNSSILKIQVTSVNGVSDIWPSTWACERGMRKDMRNGKLRDNQGAYGVAKVEYVLKGSQDAFNAKKWHERSGGDRGPPF